MGYELLEALTEILASVGIRTGEEYPAGERVEILSPVAAVGLRELDFGSGEARFNVRVLSPRILGGWCCQTQAAKAASALHNAGLTVETGQMEYLPGSDCYCVSLIAARGIVPGSGGWVAGRRWQVFCGGAEQENVTAFRAARDQGRRIVGAFCQGAPVGVTPGTGGWSIELEQLITAEPAGVGEPFELEIRHGVSVHRYTGCCWNETELRHSQSGLRLIRRGFALSREVGTDE